MKKFCFLLVLFVFMTGCGAQATFETVSDDYVQSVSATMQQVQLVLPEDAAVMTIENQGVGKLYLCDGYAIAVQTLESGDLEKTLQAVSGFTSNALQLLQTGAGEIDRYECVWVAAGENGSQVCRASILDDGSFHYVVTIMADAQMAGELTDQWNTIMSSVTLEKLQQ